MSELKEYQASVKIMRSFDYCHFEICLGTDEKVTISKIDEMRKEAARLVDKAVEQYKTAKKVESVKHNKHYSYEQLMHECQVIRENYPQSEWTSEQKEKMKRLENAQYQMSREYDYEDQWEYDEDW
jgi:hypothetical protein